MGTPRYNCSGLRTFDFYKGNELVEMSTSTNWPLEDILATAQQYWGFSELRPLQEQAIRAGLDRRDSLVVMLIRLSCWGAERRRKKSMSAFARACRLDPVMAARALPRYIGSWTIRRRPGSGRSTTQASRS